MISVTILTKNSSRLIQKVLEALTEFSEVIILDTGSTDETLEIAARFPNVIIHSHAFEGFGKTHNIASSLARHDWILSVDSDEILTESLAHEILALPLDPQCVYTCWRKNFYRGRHIKGCGWYPDRVVRLYNKNKTRFSDALVHESVITKGLSMAALYYPIIHYPYPSVSSFLKKLDTYTELFAEQRVGTKSSVTKAFVHAAFAFFRSYIFQRGFLLGSEGFEISWFNMNCAFYKYAKLAERE